MIRLTAIQRAAEWRARLPERFGVLTELLRLTRERTHTVDVALLAALEAAEDGISALGREALTARTATEVCNWIGWARRVFGMADYIVSLAVAGARAADVTVQGDLELVADDLERLGEEAGELATMLIDHAVRSAA